MANSYPSVTALPTVSQSHPSMPDDPLLLLHEAAFLESSSSILTSPSPTAAELQKFTHFESIYSSRNPQAPSFSSYDDAYDFGRKLASQLGFQIRIKTTTVHQKDGTTTKFVCCQRQGLAEHGWKPKDGVRKRHRTSVRCDCKWGCRLIGRRSQLPHTDIESFVWVWDVPNQFHEHNHGPDLQTSPRKRSPTPGGALSPASSSAGGKSRPGFSLHSATTSPYAFDAHRAVMINSKEIGQQGESRIQPRLLPRQTSAWSATSPDGFNSPMMVSSHQSSMQSLLAAIEDPRQQRF